MRVHHVAVVFIAVVAGAGSIRADMAGTDPTGVHPLAADPANRLHGMLPRPRDNAIRLAQNVINPTTGNPSVAPLKWVGMLITPSPTKAGVVNLCTGQFITPTVVLTAGHCLKDLGDSPTGPWNDLTKMTFNLQYQNLESSHTFKVVCGASNPLWTLPANYASLNKQQQSAAMLAAWQHDFAMLLVDSPSPTGVMPYALDWKGKVSGATRVGYPGDILDGAIVQQTAGIVFFANQIPMGGYSQTSLVVHWGAYTDFTQGSSGGGWVVNANSTENAQNNILIAVTSFNVSEPAPVGDPGASMILTNQSVDPFPGAVFGAYLTAAEFTPLLNSVQNGCK